MPENLNFKVGPYIPVLDMVIWQMLICNVTSHQCIVFTINYIFSKKRKKKRLMVRLHTELTLASFPVHLKDSQKKNN